jgi:hypothetical protein
VASVGSGISIFSKNRGKPIDENLSIGLNAGYFFGKKDYRSKRSLINDTVQYLQANYQDRTSFGGIQLNAGIHYRLPVGKHRLFSAGAYGTWTPTMNASQDRIRETFYFDPSFGDVRLDSVSDIKNVQGKILIPGTFTIGFAFQQYATTLKEGGWLIGLDFMVQNWEKYRFYGGMDSVRNKWEVRLGAQLNPVYRAKSYFTRVAYRAGIFAGPDYINVRQKLPLFGASFGMALPITGENRFNRGQASILNLSLEYIRRGNTDNLVHENMFRVSLGFSLSDIWFTKRRYD